jgi:hypothetical protein
MLLGLIKIDKTMPSKSWISYYRYTGTNMYSGLGYIQRTSALSTGFTTTFVEYNVI